MEVDNFYLKDVLGLGDFRLQSFEAAQKWFAVVTLAINYLQFRLAQAYLQNHSSAPLADFIRQHRLEHFRFLLRSVITETLETQQVEAAIQKLLPSAAWALT